MFKIRCFQVIFLILLFSLLFYRFDPIDGQKNETISNRLGAIFFVTINMFLIYFQTSLNTFPAEKEIFAKEYGSGMYGFLSYYIAKLSLEIPLTSIFPMLFMATIYFIVGFYASLNNFLLFIMLGVIEALVGMITGIFIGAISPNVQVSTEIAPMVQIPFMLFCGFLTNVESILPPFKIFEWISPMRYTFEFLIRNEFDQIADLGNSHPVETLNFFFGKAVCVIVLGIMFFVYVVLTGIIIKTTTKNVMN